MRTLIRGLALAGVFAGACLALAPPASARVFFSFGVPFPGYYPPPVYYPPPPVYYGPPPGYYPPPPAYYAPPPAAYAPPPAAAPTGESCYVSGTPLCPMERPAAVNTTCWCTTSSGRVYGMAR